MSLISDALQKVQAEWAQRVGKVSIPHSGSILPSASKASLWTHPAARRRVAMAIAVIVGVPTIAFLVIAWIAGSQVAQHPQSRVNTMPPASTPSATPKAAAIEPAGITPHSAKDADEGITAISARSLHSAAQARKPLPTNNDPAVRTPDDALQRMYPSPESELPRAIAPATIPPDVVSVTPPRRNELPLKGKAIAVTHQPDEVSAKMKADALALFRSGVSAQKYGDFARAKEVYRRSLRIDPSNVAVHNNLGTVYKNTNNTSAAIDAYRKALWLDPEFDEARTNLASALFERGKLDEAAEELTTVLVNAPGTLKAHAILGAIYTRLHREDEAIHAFRRALAFDPNLPEAHYNLGILLEQAGEVTEAIKHFQRFVEGSAGQHSEIRKTVEGHLDRLQGEIAQRAIDTLEQ